MMDLGAQLSTAARELTRFVIEAEHRRRFSDDRRQLHEEFAYRALQAVEQAGDER
jgi:GAF domain-containing protein